VDHLLGLAIGDVDPHEHVSEALATTLLGLPLLPLTRGLPFLPIFDALQSQ
jgi:hypothetical protein